MLTQTLEMDLCFPASLTLKARKKEKRKHVSEVAGLSIYLFNVERLSLTFRRGQQILSPHSVHNFYVGDVWFEKTWTCKNIKPYLKVKVRNVMNSSQNINIFRTLQKYMF